MVRSPLIEGPLAKFPAHDFAHADDWTDVVFQELYERLLADLVAHAQCAPDELLQGVLAGHGLGGDDGV